MPRNVSIDVNGRMTPIADSNMNRSLSMTGVTTVSPPGLFPPSVVPEGVEDVDRIELKTASFDPTYAASIHSHKRDLEVKYLIRKPFLGVDGIQTEITGNMRVTLLDWLVKLADDVRLSPSTYSLTVHLVDLALSRLSVRRSNFQLLGCACLLIAAKLEELVPPLVNDLVHRSDYCFDNEELVCFEQKLMIVFKMSPALPTRYYFAHRYAAAGKCTARETSMAIFLAELSLYKVEFSLLPMSLVSAAAVHLARQILRPRADHIVLTRGSNVTGSSSTSSSSGGSSRGEQQSQQQQQPEEETAIWTRNLEYYSSYSEHALVDTILRLREAHFYMEDTTLTQGIISRYSRERYHGASLTGALRFEDLRFDTDRARDKHREWVQATMQPQPHQQTEAGEGAVALEQHKQHQQHQQHHQQQAVGRSLSSCDLSRHYGPAVEEARAGAGAGAGGEVAAAAYDYKQRQQQLKAQQRNQQQRPGGSSSGTAAAVAANRMVSTAHNSNASGLPPKAAAAGGGGDALARAREAMMAAQQQQGLPRHLPRPKVSSAKALVAGAAAGGGIGGSVSAQTASVLLAKSHSSAFTAPRSANGSGSGNGNGNGNGNGSEKEKNASLESGRGSSSSSTRARGGTSKGATAAASRGVTRPTVTSAAGVGGGGKAIAGHKTQRPIDLSSSSCDNGGDGGSGGVKRQRVRAGSTGSTNTNNMNNNGQFKGDGRCNAAGMLQSRMSDFTSLANC